MANESQSNEEALAALIAFIERERERQRAEILDRAEKEARELVRAGRRESRRRVQEVIDRQRHERRTRLRSAEALEQARIREREHRLLRDRLDRAWQSLAEQLERRWQEPGSRRQWLQAALDSAVHHLPDGGWSLEYPDGLARSELEPEIETVRRRRGDVRIEGKGVADLRTGFRIGAGAAVLDATHPALVARRAHVEGLLLGALHGVGADADPEAGEAE